MATLPARKLGRRRSTGTAPSVTSRTIPVTPCLAPGVMVPKSRKRLAQGTNVPIATTLTERRAAGGQGASSATVGKPRPSGAGVPRIRTVRSATSRMALAHPRADPATAASRARIRSGSTTSAAGATTLTPVDPSVVLTVSRATKISVTIFRTPPTAPVATRSGESQGVSAEAGAGPATRDCVAKCAEEPQQG
jgi:hypothetical protein